MSAYAPPTSARRWSTGGSHSLQPLSNAATSFRQSCTLLHRLQTAPSQGAVACYMMHAPDTGFATTSSHGRTRARTAPCEPEGCVLKHMHAPRAAFRAYPVRRRVGKSTSGEHLGQQRVEPLPIGQNLPQRLAGLLRSRRHPREPSRHQTRQALETQLRAGRATQSHSCCQLREQWGDPAAGVRVACDIEFALANPLGQHRQSKLSDDILIGLPQLLLVALGLSWCRRSFGSICTQHERSLQQQRHWIAPSEHLEAPLAHILWNILVVI